MAGCRLDASDLRPHRCRARSQVAGVPGTPTDLPLVTSWRERVGLPRRRIDERGAGHALRRGLPAVDGVHPAGLGVVVDEVAAAADAGGVGLGHPERGRRGHRGVDGVAAVPQHPEPGRGRLGIHAGHRAAPPVRGRVLLGDPLLVGRAGLGGRGRRAREQRAGQCETEQAGAARAGREIRRAIGGAPRVGESLPTPNRSLRSRRAGCPRCSGRRCAADPAPPARRPAARRQRRRARWRRASAHSAGRPR